MTPPSPMPNRKSFSCENCDHFHLTGTGLGWCKAHPPRTCADSPTSVNQWPSLAAPSTIWCDEHKRATFATPAPVGNPHNPTNNIGALGCASCDHFQPGGDVQAPYRGLCLAHAPDFSCTADIDDQQPDLFPFTDGADTWCSEWKRRATEEPAGRPT
jgi:hypothetical protein